MISTSTRVQGHLRQTQSKTVWVTEHVRATASEQAARPYTGSGHVDMESIRARRVAIAAEKAERLARRTACPFKAGERLLLY